MRPVAQRQQDVSQTFQVGVPSSRFEPCQWKPLSRNSGKTIHMNHWKRRNWNLRLYHAHRLYNWTKIAELLPLWYMYLYYSCTLKIDAEGGVVSWVNPVLGFTNYVSLIKGWCILTQSLVHDWNLFLECLFK